MDSVEYNIAAADAIELIVEKLEEGLELSGKVEDWNEVEEQSLELTLHSTVASVSSDSLYRMAVRMGYEGTEEDFLEFLMTESKDGFINVDNRYPLATGYYTLSTAVAAVAADTTLSPEQKNGMIFTFYNGTGWDTFQFNKAYTAEDFANASNWDALKTPIADENTAGRVKLTDTIDDDSPQDVQDDTAVTPKAVVDYLNANSGALKTVASYMDLPAIGDANSIYYIEDDELFYIYNGGVWKLMTPTWRNIKIIQGDTAIRV